MTAFPNAAQAAERRAAQPRFIPVLILALCVMAVLKAANIWVSFSGADAAQSNTGAGDAAVSFSSREAADVTAPADMTAHDSERATPPSSPSDRRILEQLAQRRAVLDAREEELDTREKLLQAAEIRMDQRLAELRSERQELAVLSAERNRAEQEEFGALSNAYDRMKSRDAARIFDVLDKDILVPVAAGMRTQALAGVLAEMKPENARALTRELAGRSRLEAAAAGVGPQ